MPRLHVRVGLQKGLERAWWRSFLNSSAKVDLGDFFQTLFKDSSPARDSTNSRYVINVGQISRAREGDGRPVFKWKKAAKQMAGQR